ncbi:MAG: polymer-forming cytoskeletal protein [Thermomicrobiales bacterium]
MRDLSKTDFDWSDDATQAFETMSLVDRHSAFEGTFRSQRDLRIEGNLKGTIACDGTLFIAEGAVVVATIEAEHVTVAGDLSGEIHCRGRLQILPSGRVQAKVRTATLVIQEGAIYEGHLDMDGLERAAPRPLRARPASPVNIENAVGDRSSGNGSTFIRRLGGAETVWSTANGETEEETADEGSNAEPAG